MNTATKRLALPAVSILAIGAVLLLAGWSPSPWQQKITTQDVQASTTYRNSLSPVQTAVQFVTLGDPSTYASGDGSLTKTDQAKYIAGLSRAAQLATPKFARITVGADLWSLPMSVGRYDSRPAVNRAKPWQVAMAGQDASGAETVLLQFEQSGGTHTWEYALVRLIKTPGGWRVSAVTGWNDGGMPSALQSWFASEYIK